MVVVVAGSIYLQCDGVGRLLCWLRMVARLMRGGIGATL